jgi:hypothetical protein
LAEGCAHATDAADNTIAATKMRNPNMMGLPFTGR